MEPNITVKVDAPLGLKTVSFQICQVENFKGMSGARVMQGKKLK